MGGGFMADMKDTTMQQQTTINTTAKQRKLQHQQQQQEHPRHSHQAPSASNPNPNYKLIPFPAPPPIPPPPSSLKRPTPDPPTSTTTPTPSPPPTSLLSSKQHKKKLLKLILKVPHSSPSASSPSSSPLSRPSPRSPSHAPYHHPHLSPSPAQSPSPSSSTSPVPSSPSPTPDLSLPSPVRLLQRPKPPSQLQPNQHLQQQQKPSKPPLQQVKHPPLDSKQYPHTKSHLSSSQLQYKAHHGRPSSRLERVSPNAGQAVSDLKNLQVEPIEFHSKHRGQAESSHRNYADQAVIESLRYHSRAEQGDEECPRRPRGAEHVRPVDLVNPNRTTHTQHANIASSKYPKQTEQGEDSIDSCVRRGQGTEEDRFRQEAGELDLGHSHISPAAEVDVHSRTKRLEVQQLDEGASLKRFQRHHQQQEETLTASYPKRLRSSHQGHQEEGRLELGTPKTQPCNNKLPQISSQQPPPKKLTQVSVVQGPHGSHQNSKVSTHTSSPHPVPPSTPASMQSSAPSLSTSAVSDDAQKPSKKRKLRSVLEPESTDGQSVAADGAVGQPKVNPAMPAAASTVDLHGVPPFVEILESKDCTTGNSSPKLTHHEHQLIPAKRLLNSILDRLQKKDKFGVFAEPVDGKEVPNYYDIIKDPMDFGTMRSRISSDYYISIEMFQRDIFLICDNAMQYNGKGTVYFRHARAIKDVAEKIMEDLKVSGLSVEIEESTSKFKNGGPNRSFEKHDSCMNAGSPSEARFDNLDEVSGFLFRTSGSIDGRRFQAIDENRRSTYAPLTAPFQGNDSLLSTISGDSSHLVPTGYQLDFPYSKSLARFAADLGPVVWEIAAEKIKKALPPGCPFGRGWVGEKDTGNVVLASSTKQSLLGQSTTQQSAKFLNANGAVLTSETSVLPAIQAKFESQSKLDTQSNVQARHSQQNHVIATKTECQPGFPASSNLPSEIRNPTVFGNSPTQIERPEGLGQRVLEQPATQPITNFRSSSDNCRPLGQAHSEQEGSGKLEQMSLTQGSMPKFAGQVNLNHPIGLQSDEGGSIDDRVSNRDSLHSGRDVQDCKTSGPGLTAIHVGNVGGFPFEGSFNFGGAFGPKLPQTDRVHPMKGRGETGTNTAIRNQYDVRGAAQVNRLSSLDDSPSTTYAATSAGKNDAAHQPESLHMSRGPFVPHNLNMSLQQPAGMNSAGTMDGNAFDPARSASSSQPTQGFTLQSNLNPVVPQTAGCNQQWNHVSSRNVNAQAPMSTLPAPHSSERHAGERFKEAGEVRDKETTSLAGRITPGAASAVPRKGLIHERGFTIQQLDGRNGQTSGLDLASAMVHNLDSLNRKQNFIGGHAVASSPPYLPTSNSVSVICEGPGWRPSQLPESIQISGKAGSKLQNQVLKSTSECSDVSLGGVPRMRLQTSGINDQQALRLQTSGIQDPQALRLQTSGIQDPQAYSYGSKKHMSSMPHFLQQQFGSDSNTHGLPSQQHLLQSHIHSNPLLPSSQNPSPSNSREPNLTRQFQLPNHLGLPQAGNTAWQYMSPQMVGRGGAHQPCTAAPDLNVSLPLTKSSFDQPNGNEIQQPDLALQL